MNKSKVAVIRCDDYNLNKVYNALLRGINLLGGIDQFIKSNETILVKPNLLTNDELASTHPCIFEAVLKILKSKKNKIIYGDTPGYGYSLKKTKNSKLNSIAKKYNVKFGDFTKGREIKYNCGNKDEILTIVNAALDSDCIISLSRMKTHMGTKITGAIKNQYGCILGKHKLRYHYKYSKTNDFSQILVNITRVINPRLYVMDGIVAMQGNGPANGDPIKMNVLIISNDPVAVDATFCKIIGYNPEFLPFIIYGDKIGLGKYKDEDIIYLGDHVNDFINISFNINRNKLRDTKENKFLSWIGVLFYTRPVLNEKKCILCKRCIKVCPVPLSGIKFYKNKNLPVFDYRYCVKCYCCQEMCPADAIYVKAPFFSRFINKLYTGGN